MKQTLRFYMLIPLCGTAIALGLASIAGFFGQFSETFETLSHLRLFYVAGLALACLLLMFIRAWKALAITAIFLAINAAQILQFYFPTGTRSLPPDAPHFRLVQANLWGGKNHHYDKVISFLQQSDADVIALSEITPTWYDKLKAALPTYTYSIADTSHGGIAILSRLPMSKTELEYFGAIKRPRVKAEIFLAEHPITLIFVHPVTPTPGRYEIRNAEFVVIAEETRTAHRPVILAGDLNCTPWSYYFERLKKDANLIDTECGFGFQPTWSTHWYFPCFPIDHCLVSNEFSTRARYRGPNIGSDHLPVICDLALRGR